MLLEESHVQEALEQAKAAFPNFHNWQYLNEKHPDYFGFSLWGEFVMKEERKSPQPRRYFVTLDLPETHWHGHLSIGLPWYLWSSCDYGDAVLLDTKGHDTLPAAIAALKEKMATLFRNFCAI